MQLCGLGEFDFQEKEKRIRFVFIQRKMKFLILVCCLLSCAAGKSLFPRLPLLLRTEQPSLLGGEKIVGGTQATPNEFPWQISLQRRGAFSSYSHSCGGSVYNNYYIIDASHCVDGVTDLSTLRVVAGEHSLAQNSGYEQTRSVSSIKMHVNYNSDTFENDIALLKLSSPLDFSTGKVGPINLPAQGATIETGTTCLVTGWGTTIAGGGGSVSDVLRKVAVPIVSNSDCNSMYGGNYILSSMLCAGFVAGGADSCQGDSGGPLVTLNPNVLVGVVSWGNGCADPGYPGVYTRVASFTNWIKTNAV
ncbi:trypsin-1-like [Daphnia pulex]|uniref:trypsin-1-like n=1 Tax=Daphnia pulex TaxID=6669 RepID=UPI001EDD26AC|nr:trypsin-1-like [Daphnia pulex]